MPLVFGGLISAHKKVTYTFAHVNFLISGLIQSISSILSEYESSTRGVNTNGIPRTR